MGHFAHGAHVHQGAGEEGPDAVDVDGETALNLALEEARNLLSPFEGLFQHHPDFGATGLLPGQAGFPKAIVHGFHGHLNLVADGQFEVSFLVDELGPGNHALGLQARVDRHPIFIDVDNGPRDNGTGLHLDGL